MIKEDFVQTVIVPAFEVLEQWAQEKGLAYEGNSDLAKMPEVRQLIRGDVESINDALASYETIKEFVLAEKPFSIETGELTPSLKVKRKVVMDKFSDQIEEMYHV